MAGPTGTSTNTPAVDEGTLALTRNRPSTPLQTRVARPRPVKQGASAHTVIEGDSLWGIAAARMGRGWLADGLARLNGISPDEVLLPGTRLLVPDFTRCDMTVAFMHREMVANASGQDAEGIAAAVRRSKDAAAAGTQALEDMKKARWYEVFRQYGDQKVFEAMAQQSGYAMAEAKIRWGLLVRDGGVWDHKQRLRDMYLAMPSPPRPYGEMGKAFHFPIRDDLTHEYYYDIWSNIHFGFVGARCGFDEKTLQEGAASGLPWAGDNDEGDVISTRIGVTLWKAVGLDVTQAQITEAIVAQRQNFIAARASELAAGRGDKANNVVITDNDYK